MDLTQADPADGQRTHGTLLDGKLRYTQPKHGYRTGLEPVLLAASIPARPGDSVLEAGAGAGAGLLCLLHRVPGLTAVCIERDSAMADLAAANLAENGFGLARVLAQDVTAWRAERVFDHALANPPWHDEAGTPSPLPGRDAAKRARGGLLTAWATALGPALRPRGTLSFIVPAALLEDGVAALAAAQCGEITLLPLWPRAGVAAKLIILRGVRLGRGGCTVLPGLTLHDAGGFTGAAQDVLRGAAGLG